MKEYKKWPKKKKLPCVILIITQVSFALPFDRGEN